MIYKGFKSSVVVKDEETKIFEGTVVNTADYVSFKSDTISGIEAKFHEAVDNYIKTCEIIGKNPMIDTDKSLGNYT